METIAAWTRRQNQQNKARLVRTRLGTDGWLLVLPLARWLKGHKDPDAIGARFGMPFDFFICKITHWHPQTKKKHAECVSSPYLIAGRGEEMETKWDRVFLMSIGNLGFRISGSFDSGQHMFEQQERLTSRNANYKCSPSRDSRLTLS
jgi:hypothetical protein